MAAFFSDHSEINFDHDSYSTLFESASFFKDSLGFEVVQIDDMRFRVDTLSMKGFIGTRWTNGNVYFEFDRNVNTSNRSNFIAACNEWSNVANLEFIERTDQENYIHVMDDSGNWSYIGMIGGRQDMGIYNWNWKFIIAHEISHALGSAHEQCRSDRDNFVRIQFHNILAGAQHNFQRQTTENYTLYDFSSIMHYSQYAFSKNNLPTIEAQLDYENQEHLMGNRQYMTPLDAAAMAARYGPIPFV